MNTQSRMTRVLPVVPTEGAPDPFLGRVAGKCRLLEKIGEGGTAWVYRAFNDAFQMERVVKVLKPRFSEDEEYFPRFQQEAQLTARLDHPNIVRVYDTGDFEGGFYIEAEFIRGETLRDLLRQKRRLSERQMLAISLGVAMALRYAHTTHIEAPDGSKVKGILHRDIKPENIMILPDGMVKLMDFGAARWVSLEDPDGGKVFGTVQYMSPEQVTGVTLDVRSDFFSLGTVMYEMFTGRKPFQHQDLHELMLSIRDARYTAVRKVRPGISPPADELVTSLLMRDPRDRPSSAAEIERDIRACIEMHDAFGAGRRIQVPMQWRRYQPMVTLTLSALAFCFSVAAFFHGGTGDVKLPGILSGSTAEAQLALEKGRALEKQGDYRGAVDQYLQVPEDSRESMEARLRAGEILYSRLDQVTKARSLLEGLRSEMGDEPYLDALLGRIYYRMALYPEARERFEASLNSRETPLIPVGPEQQLQMHYLTAFAWDKEYSLLGKDPGALKEAIKAWSFYLEVARCPAKDKGGKSRCATARERKEVLVNALGKKR